MADEKGTETTSFIVGMVFFGVGVILLVLIIIVVSYFCIYRKRKRRYKKKQLSTTNHSIVYNKPDPLTITVPDNNIIHHENGQIKTLTTMSPLESPTTVYSLENGSTRGSNFLLANANEPKLHHSFDTVDNNKYVLKEVYPVDLKTAKKHRAKKAYSSKSWDKKWGSSSLFGTKKRNKRKTQRIYQPVYVREPYSTIQRDKVHSYVGSNPSLIRAYPASISSLPRGGPEADPRIYVVDQQPFTTTQSVILTRSPRSPRSLKYSTASFDELNSYNNEVFTQPHNVSHDYTLSHDHVDSTDPEANFVCWSPSMKRKLEEKDRMDATRSNSEITSVSRSGRRRGVGEHKYVYSDGTLTQF